MQERARLWESRTIVVALLTPQSTPTTVFLYSRHVLPAHLTRLAVQVGRTAIRRTRSDGAAPQRCSEFRPRGGMIYTFSNTLLDWLVLELAGFVFTCNGPNQCLDLVGIVGCTPAVRRRGNGLRPGERCEIQPIDKRQRVF